MKEKMMTMKKLLTGTVCGLMVAATVFAENAAEIFSVRLKNYLSEKSGGDSN